jgi:hypothetical protein
LLVFFLLLSLEMELWGILEFGKMGGSSAGLMLAVLLSPALVASSLYTELYAKREGRLAAIKGIQVETNGGQRVD